METGYGLRNWSILCCFQAAGFQVVGCRWRQECVLQSVPGGRGSGSFPGGRRGAAWLSPASLQGPAVGVGQALPSSAGTSPAAGSLTILNPQAQEARGGGQTQRLLGAEGGDTQADFRGWPGETDTPNPGKSRRACASLHPRKGQVGKTRGLEGICVPGLQMPPRCVASVSLGELLRFHSLGLPLILGVKSSPTTGWLSGSQFLVVCSYSGPLCEVSLFALFSYLWSTGV